MIILAIRTDKPEAELYIYDGNKKTAELKWQAHFKLAETLNFQIEEILNKSSISYNQIGGIVIYKGPGSFTGLRIGMSVANALAYAKHLPIVARGGQAWLKTGIANLLAAKNDKIANPQYGAAAHITKPKK